MFYKSTNIRQIYIKITNTDIMTSTSPITILLTLALLTICSYSAQVVTEETMKKITINSEKHFAELLLAHLGQNSGKISEEIKKYIHENNLSLINAVDEIGLVFVGGDDMGQTGFEIGDKFVEMMGENINKLSAHFLIGKSQPEITQYISQNLPNKSYQNLKITKNELSKIQKIFTTQKPRLLEQESVIQPTPAPQTSFSYITKFFFIILFMIVTFGTLASIAAMNNRKDSLLYAKFLTDVSGR